MKPGYIYFTAGADWIFIPKTQEDGLIINGNGVYYDGLREYSYSYKVSIDTLHHALKALQGTEYATKT